MDEGGSPNALAYLALFAFIPFGVALFTVMRPTAAALAVFLISFMFLPEVVALDLPGLPGIGKQEVAALACFFGCLLRAQRKLRRAKLFRGPEALVLLLWAGDVGTALTNSDTITHGVTVLPALTLHEAFSLMIFDALHFLIPFFIGRALFATGKDVRQLLAALALAGALYTPFLFVELMLSPQLHLWIYGFHQHSFIQTMRGSGYRPMVFMPHGLAVGLFMATASMASVLLFRLKKRVMGFPPLFVGLYDFAFLVWCKSLGAATYTLVIAPVLWFLRPKAMVRVATLLAVIVLLYPVLRATNIFPEKALVSAAQSIAGADRAQSLQFRFDMETLLSTHAADRPLFGWGRFRRNMVFDDTTGRDVSVSDGYWIVTYSIRGGWGFVFLFTLLLWPIFSLRRRLSRIEPHDERVMLAGLACICAVGAVDLLPNALQNAITFFFAGALFGATKALSSPNRDDDTADSPPPSRRSRSDDDDVRAQPPSPSQSSRADSGA